MKFDQNAFLHTTQGSTPVQLAVARSLWSRFRGLMLTRRLECTPDLHGLLIPDCASVHGFFMRYPLDLAYLAPASDSADTWQVTQVERLRPWGISWSRKPRQSAATPSQLPRGVHVLELPSGAASAMGLAPGARLEFSA